MSVLSVAQHSRVQARFAELIALATVVAIAMGLRLEEGTTPALTGSTARRESHWFHLDVPRQHIHSKPAMHQLSRLASHDLMESACFRDGSALLLVPDCARSETYPAA